MKIRVTFYGLLKQDAGGREQVIDLGQGATVADLLAVLAERYAALRPRLATVACAVDDELVTPDHPLRDGDAVALLPPVSGG